MSGLRIPLRLSETCRGRDDRLAWLRELPRLLRELEQRWSLQLDAPFDGVEVSCSWVASARLPDGTPAVLKVGMPHFEAEHEIAGLRFWDGDPTVRLLAADDDHNAMLLERCDPGTPLRALSEAGQDVVIAQLLRRLWRSPDEPHHFRPLSAMTEQWTRETLAGGDRWPDAGLVREGLALFRDLPETAPTQVLLATDLHAGNVLTAQRQPWLVIDPKPFIGDPAYDVTQHLLNCEDRLRTDPHGTTRRIAELAGVDYERARLWTFARLAAEPRDNWNDERQLALARVMAP